MNIFNLFRKVKNIKVKEVETKKIIGKHFQIGDIVEFHRGGFGKVTGASEFSCCVEWNDHKLRGNPGNSTDPKRKNISISLPSVDLSPRFNPIIRMKI